MSELQFVLGDKLPTVYDVAITIFSTCTNINSQKMKNVINQYETALNCVWVKSIGPDHVMSRPAVKHKITKVVKEYFNQVYSKAHRKSNKKKKEAGVQEESRESLRCLNTKWRLINNNGALFDIGRNVGSLKGREKLFYNDQLATREGRLSEEIDDEHEKEQQEQRDELLHQQKLVREEDDFIFADNDDECNQEIEDPDSEYMDSTLNDSVASGNLNLSTSRSGFVRKLDTGVDVAIQSNAPMADRPKLRVKLRTSTDEIKTTCSKVSSACGISVEKSRRVVQIVCKELYNHDIYLSANEQLLGEEGILSEEPIEKGHIPVSAADLKNLTYVIPSARTIADYKQIQASQMETMAAKALHNKGDVKAIVHFDTTSRSSIDGEWPSIILRFSNGEEFRLRPLFFAYEDRDQITELFAETFKCLSAALSILENKVIEPSDLWEKIDALMTDSVSKNLGIEDTIPLNLGSEHRPHHLLCKSHTVEALDRSNLEVLAAIEKKVNQQEVFESINPALRSFFRGKTALVEAGIDALLTLITHNKSANSCSHADLFDHICERENVAKRIFLYQQRRFAKLGKAAASILQAQDILTMLLDEIEGTNQLVESCRIYLASEIFLTELWCLAFFDDNVTFPFLNCVKSSSQDDLLVILPKLHKELLEKRTETLSDFIVRIHGMLIPCISTELENEIVGMMCVSAAEAVLRQCWREYAFSSEPSRATDISKLTPKQRKGLPTNNCISERDLTQFDKEAVVSRCRNRRFKAKNIRNNMVLYKANSKVFKINRISRKISLILSDRETSWNDKQQQKLKERLELKLKKAQKAKDYTKKLLQDCKSWGGPCTSVDELHQVLNGKDNQSRILKTEMAYYAHTHKAEKIARKQLFRINGISYKEMLENLSILLDDESDVSTSTIANLPTNEDALQSLKVVENEENLEDMIPPVAAINDMCVVVWQNCDAKYEWYIGYVKSIDRNGMYNIDHLHRVLDGSHSKWKYPSREDIQLVEPEQIIKCDIQGQWDYSPDSRKRLFTVTNAKTICGAFQKFVV